jgi:phosphoglycerate dehydrogenase-like enzyme
LYGQTLLIVGYGRIGREVAKRARAFGMSVLACSRTPGAGDGFVDGVRPMHELDGALGQADFIVLGVPLDASTTNLIDERRIAKMKSTAFIVNVARGALINEEALYQACLHHRIGGAAIDTWYRYPADGKAVGDPSNVPFRELENVIMTPHGSGWTHALLPRRCRLIAQNLDRLARGEPLLNIVKPVVAAQ